MSRQTPSEEPHVPDEREQAARLYVEQLRTLYVHMAVFGGVMVGMFVVNLATNLVAGIATEWRAWWSGWALLGWSLGIAIHWLVVRLARPNHQITSWEQLQIDKLLSR